LVALLRLTPEVPFILNLLKDEVRPFLDEVGGPDALYHLIAGCHGIRGLAMSLEIEALLEDVRANPDETVLIRFLAERMLSSSSPRASGLQHAWKEVFRSLDSGYDLTALEIMHVYAPPTSFFESRLKT